MKKALSAFLIVSLLCIWVPLPARADPVTIVIVAIAVVAAATGGTAVVNYYDCQVNVFWGCDGSGGSGSGGTTLLGGFNSGTGSTGSSGQPTLGSQGNSGQNGNGGSSSGNGGTLPQACTSIDANSCGMHGTSFLDSSGNCPATPPPDSSCAVPVLSSFFANPSRVSKGGTSVLEWSVTQATACSLSGGGLSLSGLGISGNTTTNPIEGATDFTLSCQNGSVSTSAVQAHVSLIPTYQEN